MRLRYRIAVTVFVLQAAFVGALLWVVLSHVQQRAQTEFDAKNEVAISLVSEFARSALVTENYGNLQSYIERLSAVPDIKTVLVTDDGGRVVASSDQSFLGKRNIPRIQASDSHWSARDIKGGSGSIGRIVVEYSNATLTEAINGARNRGVVVAILGFLVIVAFALWLGYALTRRLNRLEIAAEKVAAGDIDIKVGLEGADDLARVGAAFDRMIDSVKTSMNKLQEGARQYKELLEAAPDAIWISDGSKILYANQAAVRLYGAKDEADLVGRDNLSLVHPDDQEEVANRRIALSRGERRPVVELRRTRFDGEVVDTETSAIGITWDGRPANLIIARDITARKRAADELRESEQRYRSLVDDSPVPMLVVGGTAILYANAAAAHLYGFSTTEELIGTPAINRIDPDDRESWTARRIDLQRQGEPMPLVEQRRLRADGSMVNVLTRGLPLQWEGQPAILGIQIDISEQRRAEKQLQQSQKMEAIGQLTGGVAHDFNNLLAVLTMDLEELADLTEGDDAAAELIEEAREITNSAADLTSRLLTFSRQTELTPKRLDINSVIDEAVGLLRRTIGENIEIDITRAMQPWEVRADPGQLQNALLNLCVNARDAMPSAGRLTIETRNVFLDDGQTQGIEGLESGEYVQINVTDTGTGMPAEIRDKVFDPFFTTKEAGSGTGLGLSMIYGFMRQSGGHVAIYSEEGIGTTVSLYLPRARSGEERDVTEQREAEAVPMGEETILLVEDFPQLRKRGAALLEELGYTVILAENGEEAIQELEVADRVDLLFTDIVMPGGLNGFELAERMQAQQPDIKVLYTSGYADSVQIEAGLPASGGIRLRKPYSKHELAQTVRRVIDGSP